MASAKTDLCNSAIMLCGVGVQIASIEERSAEAEACRQFYDQTLERLIIKLRLPSQTKREALALIEEDPTDEWNGAWALPSDCVSPIRIVSGAMPETCDTHIPYTRMNINGSGCILTNQDDPTLEYLFREEDEANFHPLFAEAFEYALAVKISPRLVEDPAKLSQLIAYLEAESKKSARACTMNEIFPGKSPEAEQIRNR